MTSQPVFYDPDGRRHRRLRRVWWGLAVIATALVGTLIASVLINPWLPRLDLGPLASLPGRGEECDPASQVITSKGPERAERVQAALRRALGKTRIVSA